MPEPSRDNGGGQREEREIRFFIGVTVVNWPVIVLPVTQGVDATSVCSAAQCIQKILFLVGFTPSRLSSACPPPVLRCPPLSLASLFLAARKA